MGKKREATPEVFHVEVITKARVGPMSSDEEDDSDDDKKGKGKGKEKERPAAKWEYLVKWDGYDSDQDTWEPERNVAGCQRLLASFWADVGTDNADYSIGHVVEASRKWIKKERKLFAAQFKRNVQPPKTERGPAKSRKKRKITPTIDPMTPRPTVSSSKRQETRYQDDEPLSNRRPVKRKRVLSSSSDEDDIPLMAKIDASSLKRRKSSTTDRGKPSAPDIPKIPLPRRSETIITVHPHRQMSPTQQVVDKEKPKAGEPRRPTSHTSLFSQPPSPEGPLSKATPLPAVEKPAPPSGRVAPAGPPKIPRRSTNPHSKLLGMGPSQLGSGNGISTKQRLAQGALNPTLPKAVAPAAGRSSISQLKNSSSNSLMSLSFKKKSQPSLPNATEGSPRLPDVDRRNSIDMQPPTERPDPTLAALNAPSTSGASASMSPMTVGPDVTYVASPEHYTTSDHSPSLLKNTPAWTRQAPVEHPHMAEAESFLQSIMPDALSAPLLPAVETPQPVPLRLVVAKKAIPQQRISKKWSWSGLAFIDAAGGRPAPLCNVTLLDATEHTGMTFSLAMGSMDNHNLDFPSFHTVVDLEAILRACKPPLQYARLAPQEAKDGKAMITLAKYMVKKQMVILTPVSMDNNVVAHIAFFPHIITALCRRFKVPSEVQVAGSLVAVLLPWSCTPAQRSRDWRKPPSMYLPADTKLEPLIADKARWERSIRTKPNYQHAIRILQFPLWLHKFLSEEGHSRAFAVWWEAGDVKRKKAAMETMLLYSIMEQCRAKNPGITSAEVRVIFVHVGGLKAIHKLPLFLDRCAKVPHITFYTYGTHENVPPEEWGVREIYPCGGVVTFTPAAIMEDPIGVLHRIRQVQSHPLWMCYILPSVLGMIAKLHCESEDPLSVFDSGKFPYHFLLTAIEEGDLALIRAPPRDRSPTQSRDKNHEWIRDYWSSRPRDARAMLETSVGAFNAKYSNIQSSEWLSAIESEISKDLSSMQRHPAIMAEHRRYVVIRNERTPRSSPTRDGLEWCTPTKFEFRDDFFPEQT